VLAVVMPLFWCGITTLRVSLACLFALAVLGSIVRDVWQKVRVAKAGIFAGLRRLSRSYVGMQLAHTGLVVTIIGVTLTSAYSIERDVRLAPGQSVKEGAYTFVFHGVSEHEGPNYVARRGEVDLLKNGEYVRTLHPEKRIYNVQRNPMTETAIAPGLFLDLYVALGEPLDAGNTGNGAWAVRVYYKPFVRWLWLGALIMALGGAVAASDRRYRVRQQREASLPVAGEKAR
jgi:cytochrome c-type biogenesis protein CcmF